MSIERFEKRAHELDRSDPLRSFRERFHIPVRIDGSEALYFLGNSLGLQPKSLQAFVLEELEKWKRLGVEAHFEGSAAWTRYGDLVGSTIAELVGAYPHEVVLMNGLSVNLHIMMGTFFRPSGKRRKIVIEANVFPSDRYAVESQLVLHGLDPSVDLLELRPRAGQYVLNTGDVLEAIDRNSREIALVLLGGVNYYSGQVLDMAAISAAARRSGVPVGFDLAHAVGNVPLNLHDWDVDFGVWCSYKYLNAGPGAIAGCFIHERHARDRDLPRFAGWWGHDLSTRFEMPDRFHPIDSADGWQISNPPILLLAALRASLQIFEEAGMERLVQKSRRLTGFLREVLGAISAPLRIITPSEPGAHGCQLSLMFEQDSRDIHEELGRRGIHCDYRNPDVIRVAPVPLYNTFSEAVAFASALQEITR